jgi:CMP-N,N'-diacetyllegionaminic acid synthase
LNGGVRVAALIPARAGSKGIRNKNLAEVRGRSLLQWAIELAQSVPEIDRCIVSTDGRDIAAVATRLGAEVHDRPEELASDDAIMIDTIVEVRHWHRKVGAPCEQFVVLQPTSPFRETGLVQRCLAALTSADSVATFAPAALHPHRAFEIKNDHPSPYIEGVDPWLPRQRLIPTAYQLNGYVYAFWVERLSAESSSLLFGDARAICMEGPVIDIDDEHDLAVAEALSELLSPDSAQALMAPTPRPTS